MGFINRNVEYPNKKKLTVVEVNRGYDGEIESLVVEEERQEGDVNKEGTPIEASALRTVIMEIIIDLLT